MLFLLFTPKKPILVFVLIFMKSTLIAGGNDYDDDAYPDEDRRITRDSAPVDEPLGMKTSTVIKISPQDGETDESSENTPNRADRNADNALKKKVHEQSKTIKQIEKTVGSLEKELGKELTKDEEKVKVLHTPNTKVISPVVTEIREPKITTKNGKEKTILKQNLPQKPSRVVVDVKEKKDSEDGKKKWETDLVVEGKSKKGSSADTVVKEAKSKLGNVKEKETFKVNPETGETRKIIKVEPETGETKEIVKVNPVTGEAKEIIKVEPKTGKTKEIIKVNPVTDEANEIIKVKPKTGEAKEIVKVNPVTGEAMEIIKLEPETGETKEIVKVNPVTGETKEIIKVKPPTDEVLALDSETKNVIEVVESKNGNVPELVAVAEVDTKGGRLLVPPDVIDVDNIGRKPKVAVALQENQEAILNTIMDGLNPNLIRWAEQAIAAGMENVVNAVEDKYIAYLAATNKQRRKRSAAQPKKHGKKGLLKSAIKKVQSAAAKLAANEAESAAKQASTAAKLNMDVTNKVASSALKSVASAITGASKEAAQKVVDAQNRAAAEALAGAGLQPPPLLAVEAGAGPTVLIEPAPPPSPLSLDQLAAGGGAGKDLIQQTLQIQKGLNLVMRAVLKEKERVAADLARYQHKISFLLREMAGAPVEVISEGKPGVELVVERTRRRRRRAALSARHLRHLLHDEQAKLERMLHTLDATLAAQPAAKRKRESDHAVCSQDQIHSCV